MAKGIEFLFKKYKVDYIVGQARVDAPGMVSLTQANRRGSFSKQKPSSSPPVARCGRSPISPMTACA
jgi:pyruvate/2-oxoglutarate dehydrogenase complex dihydrolipoamide dehydrogenase (E3) component